MPAAHVPKICRHRAKQLGYVTLNGREFYLGPWPAKHRQPPPSVRAEYEALIARWLANGKHLPDDRPILSVNELILRYLEWAQSHYPGDGRENAQLRLLLDALREVKELFGRTAAAEFSPKKLRLVREQMVKKGWARSVVNAQVNRVRRMFKWAASEELIGGDVYTSLRAVEGLRRGSPGVRETEPVKPVPEEVIDATLPHMPPTVRVMVQVQLATGMRPGEVCRMRGSDLDTTGDLWVYSPERHKTRHHGHSRRILIGPRAQRLLGPFLAAGESYLFSPARAEAERQTTRRLNRRSKVTPSQGRRQPKANPKRAKRDRYSVLSYRNAVYRAADKAFPPPPPLARRGDETASQWAARLTPDEKGELSRWRSRHRWTVNRLRHTAGTLIRHEFGLEVARAVLGHRRVNTTEIYAEPDREKAAAAIAALG